MINEIKKITEIIRLEDIQKEPTEYEHLFEVQHPPQGIHQFRVRETFEMGFPLIGDLILDLEEEDKLEMHPFPEWVVHLRSLETVKSKPYLVVPNLPKNFIRKVSRKSADAKIESMVNELKKITLEDIIAFEYEIGINVKIPAYIPHLMISSKIDKDKGEHPPFLQVFEPKLDSLTRYLKVKTTYFFQLPFKLII